MWPWIPKFVNDLVSLAYNTFDNKTFIKFTKGVEDRAESSGTRKVRVRSERRGFPKGLASRGVFDFTQWSKTEKESQELPDMILYICSR